MNRAELLKIAKPILFNTEMVKAILAGRKTETRRQVKFVALEEGLNLNFSGLCLGEYCTGDINSGVVLYSGGNGCWQQRTKPVKPPYRKGDILWVREKTFGQVGGYDNQDLCYATHCPCGLSDEEHAKVKGWHPSIHMPREAARIFLRVTDVRGERLQDITEEGARAEGILPRDTYTSRRIFMNLWVQLYSNWVENPWVWVIKFERLL